MSTIKMRAHFEYQSDDDLLIESAMREMIEALESAGPGVTIHRDRNCLEIEADLVNLPVQMSIEDARQLQAILRELHPHAPALVQVAQDIIDTAMLLS